MSVSGETFQFWYRTVVVILLGAAVTRTGAVIKFQWDNSIDLQTVKFQLTTLSATMADVPQMKTDIAKLQITQEDIKRRMELQEGLRSIHP